MANNKLNSSEYTDMENNVMDVTIYDAASTTEIEFQANWDKWNGYYKQISILQSVIDKKAIWTVGKGFKTDETTKKTLDKIRGNGKETFNTIMDNAVKTYTICGNFYGEIVRNSRRELKNIKPLNPGSIKIIANEFGIITKYEQWGTNGKIQTFKPDEIFHLQWNKIADEIHGNGTIEKLESNILMIAEAMSDMKTVFHRYVKPLWIFSVDTDNLTEIDAFKAKVDRTVANAENLIVPKDTVDKIERVSVPQFSTLDPLPWIKLLQTQFVIAEGVPEIILGQGENTTEATSKILYLAFQQMIEYNQMFLEENLKAQLGIDVEFNFPASIEPESIGTAQSPSSSLEKSRKMNNFEMKADQKVR